MNSLSIHAKSLTSEKKSDITLAEAERRAEQANPPWTLVSHNPASRIASFKRKRDHIHIYYTTGTIAMVLTDVKQFFCTNVDLALLKLMFNEPRKHANKGYKNVGNTHNAFSQGPDEYHTLENVANNIDQEIGKLVNMRAIITERMEVEKVQMQEENRNKASVDQPVRFKGIEESLLVRGVLSRARDEYPGKNYATGIRFAVSEELHQVLDHIDMKETLCLTALPGGGVLYSMMDGSTYWKLEEENPANLPDVVDKALRTRYGEHSRLTSVAFGTHGRYYLAFANGKEMWNCHKAMDKSMRNEEVKMVAFGAEMDSYFILFADGTFESCNIPNDLYELTHSRSDNLDPVDFVNLGPNGEFFVHFEDMHWEIGGVSDEHIEYLVNDDSDITEVSFSINGWIARALE